MQRTHWRAETGRDFLEVVDTPGLSLFKGHLENALNCSFNSINFWSAIKVVRLVDYMIIIGPLELKYPKLYKCKVKFYEVALTQ